LTPCRLNVGGKGAVMAERHIAGLKNWSLFQNDRSAPIG
jgi:hypothetical protein